SCIPTSDRKDAKTDRNVRILAQPLDNEQAAADEHGCDKKALSGDYRNQPIPCPPERVQAHNNQHERESKRSVEIASQECRQAHSEQCPISDAGRAPLRSENPKDAGK